MNLEGNSGTPITLPATPRRVRHSWKFLWTIWLTRLFLMPFLLAGLILLGFVILNLLCLSLGTDARGVITRAEESSSSKGGTSYLIGYAYDVNGATIHDSDHVSEAYYRSHAMSRERIPVRFIRMGPWGFSVLPEAGDIVWRLTFIGIFALLWNPIVIVLNYGVWITPRREAEVYRWGEVALGSILSKEMGDNDGKIYHVTFCFSDSSGELFTKKATSHRDQWEKMKEGEAVTVIFNPRKPGSQCYIYEYGDVTVEGAMARVMTA